VFWEKQKKTKTEKKRNQFHQQYSLNDDLATEEITTYLKRIKQDKAN